MIDAEPSPSPNTDPSAPPVVSPRSIRNTIARVEGGTLEALSWADLGRFFAKHYFDNPLETERRAKAAKRQRLYDGAGDEQMIEMISVLLSNRTVQKLREACVAFTKVQNPTRRICQEKGTVYLAPPIRRVAGDANQRHYDAVMSQVNLDEVGQVINHLLILHKALTILPRMRALPTGEVVPTIDVVKPDGFYAVRDPLDAGLCVGIIYDLDHQIVPGMPPPPKWRFVGYHETFLISSTKEIIERTVVEHGKSTMPALLLTMEAQPGQLLDPDASADIVAAHLDIWLFHILHLKEGKSATKQTIVTGDTTAAIREQVDDTEVPIVLPAGVVATVVDRSMDFSKFLEDARKLYEACAANHGIPPELLRQGAVASADAREVLRSPLKELRAKQEPTFRRFERDLAVLLSAEIGVHPDYSFTTDGWSIDFANPQGLQSRTEENQTFETERRLNLTNTIAEIKRRNPDLSDDQALDVLKLNIQEEVLRNQLLRPLAATSGSVSAPGDAPAASPETADTTPADASATS